MMQEFVEQVNKTARTVTENMHTALPGEIAAFDPASGLASVQPKAKYRKPNGETMDFPVITGVPVMFPQSGEVAVAWPVKPGDGCLIVFAESDLDYWMYGKETPTVLKFDLSNAIAIPNISPSSNAAIQKACAEDAVVVKNGDTTVTVKSAGVFIDGDVTIKGSFTVSGGIVNLN